MRFWCSWWQPTDDYRPLRDPPNAAILGWWNSGSRGDDAEFEWSLCAVVEATSEFQVREAVRIDWPEADEWRFIARVADDFVPGGRFPIESDWSRSRLEVKR